MRMPQMSSLMDYTFSRRIQKRVMLSRDAPTLKKGGVNEGTCHSAKVSEKACPGVKCKSIAGLPSHAEVAAGSWRQGGGCEAFGRARCDSCNLVQN